MPRIRFHLGTPMAIPATTAPNPLMFDGLLGYAWALENGLTKTSVENDPDKLLFPELPLEKIADKCYAASAAFIPNEAILVPTMFLRNADWKEAMAKHGFDKMPYQVASSWTQAVQEIYNLLVTPYVDFYFRGDMGGVRHLVGIIKRLGFLGAKRGTGYGKILRVEVNTNTEDWSVWKDGQPTRPLPIEDFQQEVANRHDSLIKDWVTFHPPYWAMAKAAWCYVPPTKQYLPYTAPQQVSKIIESYASNLYKENLVVEQRVEEAKRRQKEEKALAKKSIKNPKKGA